LIWTRAGREYGCPTRNPDVWPFQTRKSGWFRVGGQIARRARRIVSSPDCEFQRCFCLALCSGCFLLSVRTSVVLWLLYLAEHLFCFVVSLVCEPTKFFLTLFRTQIRGGWLLVCFTLVSVRSIFRFHLLVRLSGEGERNCDTKCWPITEPRRFCYEIRTSSNAVLGQYPMK
jgi:hypothetical protein